MWMRLTRTSVTPLRKQPKRLSHVDIDTTIFRVGMQSVNPSIKPFCSLLREMTQVWLLQLCLPSLTGSGWIDGPIDGAFTSHTLVQWFSTFSAPWPIFQPKLTSQPTLVNRIKFPSQNHSVV